MVVRARAPLRIGLAGGGTDIKGFYDIHGGCVLNAAISRFAYTWLTPCNQPVFESIDLDICESVACSSGLKLHRAVYDYFLKTFNEGQPLDLSVTTFVDAPAGSGLGSSSTLVVSMIKAFDEYFNSGMDDYEIAELAYQIERVDCGFNGGKQDQFSASFGGVNFIEFYSERTIVNPLRIKDWVRCELESNLMLYFTGVSRESGEVISDQAKSILGNDKSLNAMLALKEDAVVMKEAVLKGVFDQICSSMREGWENKKATSSAVSNTRLNKIYESAIAAGALAGKISGAGGGGFFLFFVPMDRRQKLRDVLGEFGGHFVDFHFVDQGAQAWRV